MYKLITIIVLALSAISAASTEGDKKNHKKCVFKCPDIHGDHVIASIASNTLVCVYEHKKKEKKWSKGAESCAYDKDKGDLINDKYHRKCPHKAKRVCKKSD